MSDRKLAQAVQALFSQMQKMSKALTKGLMNWLLRTAMVANRRFRSPAAGFVLPTVVLLLLVVSLTVGALVFRAYNRSAQVIGESQQRVIYNAATPAIDRARAKLETLFDATKDSRYPGGVPAENYMTGMLRNDGSYSVGALPGVDQYTIPDETRINLDSTTKTGEINPQDNAWAFRTDTDGDGNLDATVVYSIVLQTPPDTGGIAGSGVVNTAETTKANSLWVRQGPLSNQLRGNCAIAQGTTTSSAAQGWFQDLSTSSTLRKNFQVDALVIPDTINSSGTFTTLELQQDRKLDRGNKWGAWFRYDMEIFPGPQFNWNGAMHTEGSLMVKPQNGFDAYLVSSQASCLMSTASNSEMTVTNIRNPTNDATKPADFIGLAFAGSMRDNDYSGSSNIHIWPATTTPAQPSDIVPLDNSANGGSATQTSPTVQVALDPVKLLTEGVSQARGSTPPTTPKSNRASPADYLAGWKGLPKTGTPRIFNQSETQPYVDDLYRADDRWGPKPRYSDQIALKSPDKVGDPITNAADVANLITSNYDPANPSTAASVGLDGYWERRAFNEGLRVIVGQRLELGNTNGWQTPPATLAANTLGDPLYPPTPYGAVTTLSHEARQRRTLRDNLAAVQATAIYHKDSTAGSSFPVACMASTAHPGTAVTLANSIDFSLGTGDPRNSYYNSAGAQVTKVSDFFNGYGTNGWEFAPPASTESAFITSIASTAPLGKALRNLANFAGDPKGAFPPVQEATYVHPYPNLAMWGNFSELRRTFDRLDGKNGYATTAYAALSLADKTNLHTAACTIGMLAYNLDGVVGTTGFAGAFAVIDPNNGDKVSTGVEIYKNFEDTFVSGVSPYCKSGNGSAGNPYVCTSPPATLLKKGLTGKSLVLADLISSGTQFERDRKYGFAANSSLSGATVSFSFNQGSTYYKFNFPAECSPDSSTNVLSTIYPGGGGLDPKKAALAMLCGDAPKYPALYYLFPKAAHTQDGTGVAAADTVAQPATEAYPNDTYIKTTVNPAATVTYNVVGATVNDFSAVKILPRTNATYSDWLLPKPVALGTAAANTSTNIIVAPDGSRKAVAFLDRAIFNGREMMSTRVMDIDLGRLRSTGLSNAAAKPWLPVSGIVYAFREDAVREDAIARPAGGAAPAVTNVKTLASPTDPTNATTSNGIAISTKQVDYIADPDRRPHGFRLRNGVQLKRNDSFGISNTDNTRGLSFFTDSPVYIQGDFNLHTTGADDAAVSPIEEFNEVLVPGSGANGLYTQTQFYGRTNRSTKFATIGAGDSTHDRWRPTEVLADAVSILSNDFCDGSIEDAFVGGANPSGTVSDAAKYKNTTSTSPGYGLFGPGCTNGGKTSFLNQNRPTTNLGAATWQREDGLASATATLPIGIDRNGNPLKADGTPYTGAYDAFSSDKSLMAASSAGTTVDSIIVSGIVPSRAGQSYGGLHNFPRFLESWDSKNLWFAGSFLQLSFSNSATAPYDQDTWEPPLATSPSSESISYYKPPNRIWGYDPALQLAPAGPAAARFITAGKNRNEFYTELPANDPYIKKLCNAAKTSGITGVPANINCPA